jgi:transcriptional regulator with XRE-family HTH domain
VRGGEPSPERRRLALRLFQLREDAGLSQQQLALRLGFSKTKVLKLESGHTTAKTTDVEAWGNATGAPAAEVASLREMAQQARAEAFSLRGRTLAGLQQEVASRERAARTIRSYYPTGIPGLLQTRAYIEALFAAGHLAVPLTEAGIMARLARQGILHDESRHFEFLLYEGALRWDFAPDRPGAHLAQLERIRLTAAFPNVEVGILPVGFGGSVWWRHPIDLLEDLAAGEPYAEAETLTAVVPVTDPADIERIRRILASLRERALAGEEAVAHILRIEENVRS